MLTRSTKLGLAPPPFFASSLGAICTAVAELGEEGEGRLGNGEGDLGDRDQSWTGAGPSGEWLDVPPVVFRITVVILPMPDFLAVVLTGALPLLLVLAMS